jgi:peptidoglycan/xylan/chitin deacetylase (PgdA/CDA1 family)
MIVAALLLAAVLWFSWRYAWWRPRVDPRFPRILMYHMIAPPKPGTRFNGLRVAPERFERQLRWLRERGWHSFTVSELVDNATRLPPRSFAISFDDGYADNLLTALPLLRKYGCKATVYLVVQRDRDWSVERNPRHDGGELVREPKLSDAQVRQLLASGCIELGSHSLTHANLQRQEPAAVQRELRESRRVLEQRYGAVVRSFAYPFGLYLPAQVELVRQAGYTSAVTTREAIADPARWQCLELPRLRMSGRDSWLAFLLRMRGGRRGW